jgi:hypothetical protein
MMHRYAFTNVELSFLLQQKGNETMPTIDWTPLKTKTLTITANKVDDPAASIAIALSVRKKTGKKKNKITKEK